MAKVPPQFAAKKAPAKTGGKPSGNPFAKGASGKMCSGCKNPACKRAGKCMKG